MNFKNLLQKISVKSLLNEAPEGSGTAEKKERAKSASADAKARDAARKRVERSQATPREKQSKQELIKDVLLVKTKGGNIQLIFKDSFNAGIHQKLNKQELTIDEAQQATKENTFEQTRASKLLFGDVKTKESAKKEAKGETKEEGKRREEARPKTEEEKENEEKGKAKKMSKEQMFQAMSEMDPEQLMSMPAELRNEYFKMVRNPPANKNFDRLSYENLTVEFGLSNLSGVSYNQQVLNALVFLAKLKAGASDQEMQTYLALAPDAREFTRGAFFTAQKILSQIGDECLQNLLTNVETTGQSVVDEGSPDMQCGNYRFKVAAGGEISFSTTDFNQSNKNFKGYVAKALTQALSNPQLIASNKKLADQFEKMEQGKTQFSNILIPDDLMGQIRDNPSLMKQLQKMEIKDPRGEVVGTIVDSNGELNQLASLSSYRKAWEESAKDLMKAGSKNLFAPAVINDLLKTTLRGDGIADPEMAPNHVITINGIFPMTDEYFATISQTSNLDAKPAKNIMSSSNVSKYKPSAAEMMKTFTTVVEQKEMPELSLKNITVNKDEIEPIQVMVDYITKNYDFSMNASLLPGFSPEDLNAVEYTYVTIGKKTTKIPVMKGENISGEVMNESALFLNDVLVESLNEKMLVEMLYANQLISEPEALWILENANYLTEDSDYVLINLKSIYENILINFHKEPMSLASLIDDLMIEEYKRDYKKEYRNYHGKPKQRKERAKRTKAREMMIKKGRAKKGDGKDIDHKNAIRNGGSNGINNLRVRDRSSNRSDNGHKKGESQNKNWK